MQRTLNDFQDLTPSQRAILERFEREERFTKTFYFTGGTLLKALGIVPRESNDLDFFTFPETDGRTYMECLGIVRTLLEETCGADDILNTERGFLLKKEGTRVECVYDVVRNINDFVPFGNLKTSSLRDFAANKAAAFCVRDEVKDYIDIAFLTKKQGWLLKDLAANAEERFHLGTISEEKLLTELLSKRDMLTIPPEIFLRDPEKNRKLIEEQVAYLLNSTTL